MAETGMLAAMLRRFENQISLFPNAAFEEEDGELVLVVQGDADNIRFSRSQTGNRRIPLKAACMSANDALRTLVRNGWFEFSDTGCRAADQAGRADKEGPRGEGGRDGGCGVAGKWLSLELGSGEEALQLESVDYQLLGSAVVRETFPHKWAPTGRDVTGADKPA